MHLEVSHNCSQEEAVQRIDGLLEKLLEGPIPEGIEVRVAQKQWRENLMEFSFTAGKGVFSTSISGKMLVTAGLVILDSDLPSVVNLVIGEEGVKTMISRKLEEVLNN